MSEITKAEEDNSGLPKIRARSRMAEIDTVLFDITIPSLKTISCEEKAIRFFEHHLPEHGIGTRIHYGESFIIVDTSFQLQQDITDEFTIDGEYIHLTFLFRGTPKIIKPADNPLYHWKQDRLSSGVLYNAYLSGVEDKIFMEKGSDIRYVTIFLLPEYFLSLFGNERWAQNDALYNNVILKDHVKIYEEITDIDFDIQQLFLQIVHNNFPEEYRPYYLDIKLKELLFTIFLRRNTLSESNSLSPETRNKITEIKSWISLNYSTNFTIKDLAKIAGINEVYLKNGFRKLFNMTIRTYVIQLRMEKAKVLLQQKGLTISEISAEVGYQSVQHFIQTFRKYAGYTPGKVLKVKS